MKFNTSQELKQLEQSMQSSLKQYGAAPIIETCFFDYSQKVIEHVKVLEKQLENSEAMRKFTEERMGSVLTTVEELVRRYEE